MVLLGGQILTVDARDSVREAVAIRGGRIAAVGSDAEIQQWIGDRTTVIPLQGKTVVPGFIEEHVHVTLVAEALLSGPYAALPSIAAEQDWIRREAANVPAGQWIKVPRNDITRIAEHRHPTPAELDAACTTHPVAFNAARKWVFNTLGFRKVGATAGVGEVAGGKVIRDRDGNPRMIAGAEELIQQINPAAVYGANILAGAIGDKGGESDVAQQDLDRRMIDAMHRVILRYNEAGITSITEREVDPTILRRFRALVAQGRLSVRVTMSFPGELRNAEDVRRLIDRMGLKPREGDDWLRAGQLKIFVDGGIHWGTTFLREPYGVKRAAFYALDDPDFLGNIKHTTEEMAEVFAEGHRQGWQMCCHATGDAAVDRVLDALEAANRHVPLADRRFTLCHCYFPIQDAVERCRRLGVCAGTHPCIYYKDSEAIAEVYGLAWAERFIGVGDWLRGGVPVAFSCDHMEGLEPEASLHPYSPMLQLYAAVTRKNEQGRVYGPRQKLSRAEALRSVTYWPAYLNFNENSVGSIEPGKLADLVVLDRDYLTCPEEEIRQIKVLRTILDGKTVYERK